MLSFSRLCRLLTGFPPFFFLAFGLLVGTHVATDRTQSWGKGWEKTLDDQHEIKRMEACLAPGFGRSWGGWESQLGHAGIDRTWSQGKERENLPTISRTIKRIGSLPGTWFRSVLGAGGSRSLATRGSTEPGAKEKKGRKSLPTISRIIKRIGSLPGAWF
jgi:hypothetical protein